MRAQRFSEHTVVKPTHGRFSLKQVKHKPPLAVDPAKCVGCKNCMKIGCPAISMRDGKARVDFTQCVGCGVCEQLCGAKAFYSTAKEA